MTSRAPAPVLAPRPPRRRRRAPVASLAALLLTLAAGPAWAQARAPVPPPAVPPPAQTAPPPPAAPAAAAPARPGPGPAQPLLADLSQNRVEITTGFAGAQLLVFGAIEGGGDVLVVARGPAQDMVVRRKVEVAGMWINGAQARFWGVPSFYALTGTAPAHEVLGEVERRTRRIGIDTLPLGPRGPDGGEAAAFTEAFIALKQAERLYGENEAEFALVGGRLFQTRIALPSTVPTGDYQIDVYLVRDRALVQTVALPLAVRRVGLGATIWRFARSDELAYGLAAILLAALTGWLGSILFRRG